jgi:uncharacterized membrane protein YjjP (DUF1212 family)
MFLPISSRRFGLWLSIFFWSMKANAFDLLVKGRASFLPVLPICLFFLSPDLVVLVVEIARTESVLITCLRTKN